MRAPTGLLKRATVDRVLRALGLGHARVTRPVAAVRFQAKRSNELWHFDMSLSDLKQVEARLWPTPASLSANPSRNQRCLRARRSMIASAYT